MTTAVIITICVLLLLAYIFDISASLTKIPSVILLLALGIITKQIVTYFELSIPNLAPILPILGTIGLIMIVLEGSLELEINKHKLETIRKSSLMATIPMFIICFGLAIAFQQTENTSIKIALANAIPFTVISSAIAISSARSLNTANREFIIYESSLSDIVGVIFFNFITLNDNIGTKSVGHFIFELIMMIAISFVATLFLSYFLHKIKHHIKYTPIIIILILIYSISKVYHLPALLFILFFGLFMNNINSFRRFKFIRQFHPINFSKEVHKFSELTTELVFLVRALFFILFGYLINVSEIINQATLPWAVCISVAIFIVRYIFLKVFKLTINPLFFFAPRGLITILLFMSIPAGQKISIVNNSLIIQVIIFTAIIMMVGLMYYKPEKEPKVITQESH